MILTAAMLAPGTSVGAAQTFNSALPVAEGNLVVRQQFLFLRAGDDTGGADRDLEVFGAVSVIGYGIGSDLALFGMLPYLDKQLDFTTPGGERISRGARGRGDAQVFARYTVLQKDGRGQSFRVAPFLGIELPTGDDHRGDAREPLPHPLQPRPEMAAVIVLRLAHRRCVLTPPTPEGTTSMQDITHDLVVIGTGTAATVTAMGCRKAGWSVAVVDHRPFGGTCALRGCDPKKMLIAAAEAIDAVERMGDIDTVKGDVRIDWAALQRHKRTFTDPVPEKREQAYAKNGIDAYHGRARFSGRDTVVVDGVTLRARHIVIAAGAEPVELPIEGAEHLATSDDFLELESLPRRIVLVGGGYIGFEFAHIAARAGAQVTILNRGKRALAGFDPDLVDLLVERTRALGVDVRLGYEVEAVRRSGDGFKVEAQGPDAAFVAEADLAVHSGGRKPALEALDLDAAGIAHEKGRLSLDSNFRSTSNPIVYAAGDAAGGPLPLTPVASLEAHSVVDTLLGRNNAGVNYTGIPSAVFTLPPLARVGMQEAEAKEQGLRFQVKHESVPGWFTARRVNESCYGYKVLVEEGSGRILGAHLVGPDAAEVINLFGFAMRSGLDADAIRHAIFTYPTAASDIESMLP